MLISPAIGIGRLWRRTVTFSPGYITGQVGHSLPEVTSIGPDLLPEILQQIFDQGRHVFPGHDVARGAVVIQASSGVLQRSSSIPDLIGYFGRLIGVLVDVGRVPQSLLDSRSDIEALAPASLSWAPPAPIPIFSRARSIP
jgi:hypothetical protein